MKKRKLTIHSYALYILSLGLCLHAILLWVMPVWGIGIEIINPANQQVIANILNSGNISLGTVDPFCQPDDLHPRIDGVYAINTADVLQSAPALDLPKACLYVIGASQAQAGLQIELTELGEQQAELYASYSGDLQVYLADAQTNWQSNTSLNSAVHLLIPADQSLIPLRGEGGLLDLNPLDQTDSSLSLDLAVRVENTEEPGSKSGQLIFTIVAQ